MEEEAVPQYRWGRISVSGDEPERALQAQGGTDLLHTAWQPPLLQTHIGIALEGGIGALHVEVSLQCAGEAWQPWQPAPHGGQVWLLEAHVQGYWQGFARNRAIPTTRFPRRHRGPFRSVWRASG